MPFFGDFAANFDEKLARYDNDRLELQLWLEFELYLQKAIRRYFVNKKPLHWMHKKQVTREI